MSSHSDVKVKHPEATKRDILKMWSSIVISWLSAYFTALSNFLWYAIIYCYSFVFFFRGILISGRPRSLCVFRTQSFVFPLKRLFCLIFRRCCLSFAPGRPNSPGFVVLRSDLLQERRCTRTICFNLRQIAAEGFRCFHLRAEHRGRSRFEIGQNVVLLFCFRFFLTLSALYWTCAEKGNAQSRTKAISTGAVRKRSGLEREQQRRDERPFYFLILADGHGGSSLLGFFSPLSSSLF